MIVECPDCGTPIPPDAEVCPECKTLQSGPKQNDTANIIAAIIGLIVGAVVSLLLLPLGGEIIFFYAIWTLPALLCVLGYHFAARLMNFD